MRSNINWNLYHIKERHYHLRKNFNPSWKEPFRLGSKISMIDDDGNTNIWTVCRYRSFGKYNNIDSFDCPTFKVTLKRHSTVSKSFDKLWLYGLSAITRKPIQLDRVVTRNLDLYVCDLHYRVKNGSAQVIKY